VKGTAASYRGRPRVSGSALPIKDLQEGVELAAAGDAKFMLDLVFGVLFKAVGKVGSVQRPTTEFSKSNARKPSEERGLGYLSH
jgi:hypothetical protein